MDHILTLMLVVHQFLLPKTVVSVRTKARLIFCYRLWVWPQPWHSFRAAQGLDPSLQLAAKHSCPASKTSASVSWNWKGAPAWAAGDSFWYQRNSSVWDWPLPLWCRSSQHPYALICLMQVWDCSETIKGPDLVLLSLSAKQNAWSHENQVVSLFFPSPLS